ncbi:MAG: uridine kinase [Elusimicrobiales bacterium]|nr:uridine kinase [Elusimicrobiales bacterium]
MDNTKKSRFIIGIAGGSGSGKTTLAGKLVSQCAKIDISGQIFSLDNYYQPLDHLDFDERRTYNFDHPDAIDSALAVKQLHDLCSGKAIHQPVYDFKQHTREKEAVTCKPTQLIVVEGLYTLYFPKLANLCDFKIFVSTGMVTAVLRRVQRDISERGRDIEGIKHQILATVLPMYETYVKPTQKNAHFSINWEGEEIPGKATEGLVRMMRDHFR